MSDDVYRKLAGVLDTLPSGFPSTEGGVEIKILKKIFEPDEAKLFCDLRMTHETPGEIAQRSGRPLQGLEERLLCMWKKGQIEREESDGIRRYRMMPWVLGIYEGQLNRMDREFAELCEQYNPVFGIQFLMNKPTLMQVLPVEKEIPVSYEALTYEKVSSVIENGKSFAVNDCICKKQKQILGKGCDKPLEICMAIGLEPGVFEDHPWGGRVISKDEAYEVLRKAEEAGLVHMTSNTESGNWFICNCCGCCCGQLIVTGAGLQGAVNSHFYAEIDPDKCVACGTCADERCQVKAVEKGEDFYRITREKCIGCGLCVTTCPSEAIRLVHKEPQEIIPPVKDERAWLEERARSRGVDFSGYR